MKIQIIDKETRLLSEPVDIEEVIYNQNEIEFSFPNGETLPYSDFLFYKDDYELWYLS